MMKLYVLFVLSTRNFRANLRIGALLDPRSRGPAGAPGRHYAARAMRHEQKRSRCGSASTTLSAPSATTTTSHTSNDIGVRIVHVCDTVRRAQSIRNPRSARKPDRLSSRRHFAAHDDLAPSPDHLRRLLGGGIPYSCIRPHTRAGTSPTLAQRQQGGDGHAGHCASQ